MPLSKEHKSKTRARIIDAAANLFRARGVDGVGIDAIMAEAGLTRGGFYAHFSSKQDLFETVVAQNHDLISRLEKRDAPDPETLQFQAWQVLDEYLNPDNAALVGPNCTFATLSADVARAGPNGKRAMQDAVERFARELGRGRTNADGPDEQALNVLMLAVGAQILGRAVEDSAYRSKLLSTARHQISDWMKGAEHDV